MRYWKPFIEDVIPKIEDYSPEQIILLPLYPQYSTTTTGSSFNSWWKAIKGTTLDNTPSITVCSYPINKGLISAQVDLIKKTIESSYYKGVSARMLSPIAGQYSTGYSIEYSIDWPRKTSKRIKTKYSIWNSWISDQK